jgi:hypothetical protein
MHKGIGFVIGLVAMIVSVPLNLPAMDIGAPIYQKDVKGDFRLELIVEGFDREVETELAFDNDASLLDGSYTDEMDQNVFMARFYLPLSSQGTLFIDAGVIDDDSADDTPFTVGVGAQVKVYQERALRINLVAEGHWVPSYDFSEHRTSPHDIRYTLEGDKDYYELGAGLLVSGSAAIGRQAKLIPYGGLMISMLEGSGDIEAHDIGYVFDGSLDLEEDRPVVAVAGVTLILQRSITLRLEGRFIGDGSISAGIGLAF